MAVKSGSKVRADIKRNRLYITLPASVSKRELEKVYTDVRFCVADLKPGFDVITDLSLCTIGHLNGIPIFSKIMEYLVQHRPGEVVRVIGSTSVLFKQLIRLASRFQSYKPIYVDSLEEAEERLTTTRRSNLRFRMNSQAVEYAVGDRSGSGQLVDASTGGCAIGGATLAVAAGDAITLGFTLRRDRGASVPFTLPATVLRAEDGQVAVQFEEMDEEQKGLLYTCLAFEAKWEIPLSG